MARVAESDIRAVQWIPDCAISVLCLKVQELDRFRIVENKSGSFIRDESVGCKDCDGSKLELFGCNLLDFRFLLSIDLRSEEGKVMISMGLGIYAYVI